MSLVLGVDVGSQSIKAVLVDEGGDVVATGSAALTMIAPSTTAGRNRTRTPIAPHCATPSARRPQASTRRGSWRWALAVRSTASSRATPTVSRCARRSSGWTSGPPSSAIGWSPRSGTELLAERTGLVADASHSAPKMMWIRDHEPQVWQRAATLAPVGSYLLHHLTGSHAQDAANASSTMVYDVSPRRFRRAVCARQPSLDPAMFAPVRPSTEVVGTLLPDVASEFGLPAELRGGRRHRRRTRRVGRGGRDRGRCRRRRHRNRRTGDDRIRGARARPARSRRDARPCGARLVADRESRIRQRRQHALARRAARCSAGRGLPAGAGGATGQRRRAVPARTVGVDGTAVERPDAWRLARPRDEPHAGARRAGGARRLRICVARHRRTTRRARPRSRRDTDRRRRRARRPVGDDQGQRARQASAPGADRGGHRRRRRDGRRGGHRVLRGLHRGIGCRPARSGRHRPRPARQPRPTRTPTGAISPRSTPSNPRWRSRRDHRSRPRGPSRDPARTTGTPTCPTSTSASARRCWTSASPTASARFVDRGR